MQEARDVFVFIDGTDCSEDDETNVLKLYRLCREAQKTVPGIECHYEPGLDKDDGLAFLQKVGAFSFKRQVKNAYRFLSGIRLTQTDRLHIFGYSRGAVAAMVLAHLIVDRKDRARVLGPAFDDDVTSSSVNFLGLFDPVVGYIHKFFAQFGGAELRPAVEPAIHSYLEILSLDERRWYLPMCSAIKNFEEIQGFTSRSSRALSFDVPASVAPPFQRPNALMELLQLRSALQKTSRNFIALPGLHGEIGGQYGEPLLQQIALDSVLQILFLTSAKTCSSAFGHAPARSVSVPVEEIRIGRNISFAGKLSQFRPRSFPRSENIHLHHVVDELLGRRGVLYHRFFSRWRKYRVPKALRDNRRIKL